jgi:aldehyde dehydrogenase (NAD+)
MVHLSSFYPALLFSLLLLSLDTRAVASRDSENLVESLPRYEFFINGTWTTSHTNPPELLEVIDPSIGEVLTNIAVADQVDVDRAVTAAREAFPKWSQQSFAERIALVEALAEEYEDAADDLAWLISREMGAPIDLARTSQVTSGMDQLALSLLASREYFHPIEFVDGDDKDDPSTVILKQPIGVVAMITPWNWSLNQSECLMVLYLMSRYSFSPPFTTNVAIRPQLCSK